MLIELGLEVFMVRSIGFEGFRLGYRGLAFRGLGLRAGVHGCIYGGKKDL